MSSEKKFQLIHGGRKTPRPAKTGRLLLIDSLEAITQEAVDFIIGRETGSFGSDLAIARAIFKDFPELVTAPCFPEFLRKPLSGYDGGYAPEDCTYNGVPVITDMKEILAEARRIAPLWRENRQRSA
jgi:hypothetical protein